MPRPVPPEDPTQPATGVSETVGCMSTTTPPLATRARVRCVPSLAGVAGARARVHPAPRPPVRYPYPGQPEQGDRCPRPPDPATRQPDNPRPAPRPPLPPAGARVYILLSARDFLFILGAAEEISQPQRVGLYRLFQVGKYPTFLDSLKIFLSQPVPVISVSGGYLAPDIGRVLADISPVVFTISGHKTDMS